MVTRDFDAEKWSDCVVKKFGGKGSSPKGQDPRLSFNIRSRRIAKVDASSVQQQAQLLARQYAETHL